MFLFLLFPDSWYNFRGLVDTKTHVLKTLNSVAGGKARSAGPQPFEARAVAISLSQKFSSQVYSRGAVRRVQPPPPELCCFGEPEGPARMPNDRCIPLGMPARDADCLSWPARTENRTASAGHNAHAVSKTHQRGGRPSFRHLHPARTC